MTFYVNVKPVQYLCGGFAALLISFVPFSLTNPTVGGLYVMIALVVGGIFVLGWQRKKCPVRVVESGIEGQNVWGKPRFCAWVDISYASARYFTIGHKGMILRSQTAPRDPMFIPLYLEDKAGFIREVLAQAPADCPICEVLKAELNRMKS